MTTQVNMHEAKSNLSKLAELVRQGETVVIAKAGKPCMDLVAHKTTKSKRKPGRFKEQISMAADFDATSEEIISLFEGRDA